MPFASFKESESREFTRPVYYTFTPGQHIIRILEEEAPTYFCYWLGSGYVLSPDENDPIREKTYTDVLETVRPMGRHRRCMPRAGSGRLLLLSVNPDRTSVCRPALEHSVEGLF